MQSSLPIPAPGKSERISGLYQGADALALARLARELKSPLVIITASAFDAQRLLE